MCTGYQYIPEYVGFEERGRASRQLQFGGCTKYDDDGRGMFN